MTHSGEEIAYKPHIRQLRERLDAINEMREAKRLSLADNSQREIAEILNTTLPRVRRMLRGSKALDEGQTPEEVILQATLDGTPREKLVKYLSIMDYTFATYAPSPHEGSIPGTWTQVGVAHMYGLLSDEEYEEICGCVRPPSS